MDKLGDQAVTISAFKEDGNYEIENQFILRLPSGPAAALKSVVASGVLNLKDRLSIQIEQDMKHGTVRFDNWILPSKIVDLPCIIESHKTLDKKNFYKTADICQIMICTEESEDLNKDALKIDDKKIDGKDKRFIYPHGITPPLKNVRKKRFRKTLKKKTVDVPEIEKEVKRLFRQDNEAISVRYEVVDADDEKADSVKHNSNAPSPGVSGMMNTNSQSMDQYLVEEHDLFGQVLSSSDEDEDTRANESDDLSRMSMGLNKTNESTNATSCNYVTEFSKDMLMGTTSIQSTSKQQLILEPDQTDMQTNESVAEAVASLEHDQNLSNRSNSNNDSILNRLSIVEIELADIEEKLRAQELQIASIENFALQQRLQKEINDLKLLESQKRKEHEELMSMLND